MGTHFATYAAAKNDLLCNYLLACSIKEFAGNLSGIPLRIYVSSDLNVREEIKRFSGLEYIEIRGYAYGGFKRKLLYLRQNRR